MNNIEDTIDTISDALYGLIDAGVLPDCTEEPDCFATDDDVEYTWTFSFSVLANCK